MPKLSNIRPAQLKDCGQILELIQELAIFEKAPNEVKATVEDLEIALFSGIHTPHEKPAVFAVVIDDEENPGKLSAFAIYFLNFSTWLGKHGIYLEDLYVRENKRGQGLGKALLEHLAEICVENNYGRFEWWVLDWNTPAWDFYKSQGAIPMSEWTVHRVDGENLRNLGEK